MNTTKIIKNGTTLKVHQSEVIHHDTLFKRFVSCWNVLRGKTVPFFIERDYMPNCRCLPNKPKENIFDIITRGQCEELKKIGLVVVHREPQDSMIKAFYGSDWPETVEWPDCYHRMVADSINKQNEALK